MHTCKADILAYSYLQDDGLHDLHLIDMHWLKNWFWNKADLTSFTPHTMEEENRTRSLLVPHKVINKANPTAITYWLIQPDGTAARRNLPVNKIPSNLMRADNATGNKYKKFESA